MCGILAALGLAGGQAEAEKNRRDILRLSHLLKHRGPDQRSIYQAPDGRAFISFERLMIVDPTDTGRRACSAVGTGLHQTHVPGGSGGGAAAESLLGLGRAVTLTCAKRALLQAALPDPHPRGQHCLGAVSGLRGVLLRLNVKCPTLGLECCGQVEQSSAERTVCRHAVIC